MTPPTRPPLLVTPPPVTPLRQGLVAAISVLAGAVHGFAFGATHPAALQLFGLTSLAAIVFWLRSWRRWGSLFLCIAGFWLASYAIGLRWMAAALVSEHVLGIALGGLTYGLLTVALCWLSVLCLWMTAVLSAPIRSEALCCALFSSALVVGEALREFLLPSFPWLSVGYAHIDSPFAWLLPLIGIQGVDWIVQFAAFLIGALGVSAIATRSPRALTLACAAAVAIGVGMSSRLVPTLTHDAGSLRVAVMQTAISTKDKFRASLLARHLTEIGDFAQNHDAQLILTPETAVPTTLRALTPVQEQFLERSVSPSRALLFGAFAEDSRGDVFNSAVMLQRAATTPAGIQRTVYIKRHLAPIGEYAPLGFRWLADLLNLPLSNLRSTEDTPRNFQVFGITIIPSVCQDLLYGDDLRTTSAAPRMLVNLSNVAFFSDSLARDQFLNIARARALEQQVPVLIAANVGPTAFIDAEGAIERQLPPAAPGALEVVIRPRQGTTPYARFGDAFVFLMFALTGVWAVGGWADGWFKSRRRPKLKSLTRSIVG
jgi:apolipoprotein N-acyltransferase